MKTILLLAVLIILLGGLATFMMSLAPVKDIGRFSSFVSDRDPSTDGARTIGKFGSEEEFRTYLAAAKSIGHGMASRMGGEIMTMDAANEMSVKSSATPERVSGTNVQVAGIDEPDIVKTDGSSIYFSREPEYRILDAPVTPLMEKRASDTVSIFPAPVASAGRMDIVSATPANAMAKQSSIERSGEMLLFGNILVVFDTSRRDIAAFDVSDRAAPKEAWSIRQAEGTELVAARNREGVLYLVERTIVNEFSPCLITPFSMGDTQFSIPCTDIYRSSTPTPSDSVFTAVSIDPATGSVKTKTSFVGSAGQSIVSMSENAIYATSPETGDPMGYILGFFRDNRDLLPEEVFERLEKLSQYDLGQDAKMMEFSRIIEQSLLSRDADDRLRFQTEMGNRMSAYAKAHLRELESTGIVKLSLPDLSLSANGSVPGSLLNQFSLDEYEGRLRVATTVGGRGSSLFGWISVEASANDVYVLDANLKQEGMLSDLGVGERIYAARFLGDTGYLVTFKETDPFYVLDLSDPRAPRKAGELKIPGYSSYLHPLGQDMVLGVGKEGDKVKLSLFDVSSPDDPKEISKYVLDEYWSEAIGNHHAFLADPEHKIFFLPGYQGGYVFSYEGNTLSLKKSVKDDRTKRALFIGDTFSIVSENAIYTYDIRTWEKQGELRW